MLTDVPTPNPTAAPSTTESLGLGASPPAGANNTTVTGEKEHNLIVRAGGTVTDARYSGSATIHHLP